MIIWYLPQETKRASPLLVAEGAQSSILFLRCAATLFVPWFQLLESSSPLRALGLAWSLVNHARRSLYHPELQSTCHLEPSSSFSNDWSASLVASIDVTPKPCRSRPRQDGALSESWEQNDGNLVFHFDWELRCSYFEVEWSKWWRVSVGEREQLFRRIWNDIYEDGGFMLGWPISQIATWCPR